MFHKTATLSVFALLLAVASCRPQVDLFDCSDKEDGPHADPLDNNAFYVCFGGELTVRSKCDPEEYFDAAMKICAGGQENEDLTAYLSENEDDASVEYIKSSVSDLLNESVDYLTDSRRPPHRPPQKPQPPQKPNPPQKPHPPHLHHLKKFKKQIYNIQVTDNIFPKSIIVIGRANREQKNK